MSGRESEKNVRKAVLCVFCVSRSKAVLQHSFINETRSKFFLTFGDAIGFFFLTEFYCLTSCLCIVGRSARWALFSAHPVLPIKVLESETGQSVRMPSVAIRKQQIMFLGHLFSVQYVVVHFCSPWVIFSLPFVLI